VKPRFVPSTKQVREAYADAVDPEKVVKPVTRLSQMSPEKIAELEKLYGAKVIAKPVPLTRPPPEKVKLLDTEMTDFHPKCPNPNCDHHMKLRESKFSKYGPSAFYGCMGYPSCKTTWGCYGDGRPKGEPRVK
jgi:hypothetical protein